MSSRHRNLEPLGRWHATISKCLMSCVNPVLTLVTVIFSQLLEEGCKSVEVKETLARAYLKLEQHQDAEQVS